MKKRYLFFFPLLLFGILAFAGCQKKTVPEQSKNTSESTVSQQERKILESSDKIAINVSYPELQNVESAQAESTANNMLKKYAENLVSDFKKSIRDNSFPLEGAKSTLDARYSVKYLSPNIASFEFSNSLYIEGAAHPSNALYGLNFNLKSGKKIELTDVFDAKTDYLKALSQKTIQNLKAQAPADSLFDDDTLSDALSPKAENFSDFVIESDGLTFLPAPYSVAPYASGPQSVKVDFSDIKSYLSADFLKLINF